MNINVEKLPPYPGDPGSIYRCTTDTSPVQVEIDVSRDGLSVVLPGLQGYRGQASVDLELNLDTPQLQEASVRIMAGAAFQLLAAHNELQ